MERREVHVENVGFHAELDEYEATGTISRFGCSLCWVARRPAVDPRWDVEFPEGQADGDDGEATMLLVYEGDPPAGELVRRVLSGTRST